MICDKKVPMKQKHKIDKTTVWPTWCMGPRHGQLGRQRKTSCIRLRMRMLRWVQGVSLREHEHNRDTGEAAGVIHMETYFMRRRLQWYEHVRGRGEKEPTQQVYEGKDQEENEGQGYYQEGHVRVEWRIRMIRTRGSGTERSTKLSFEDMAC